MKEKRMKKEISKVLLASLLVLGLAGVSNATSCPVDRCSAENKEVKAMVFQYRQLVTGLKGLKEQVQFVKAQTDKPKVVKIAEIKELRDLATDYKTDLTELIVDIKDYKAEWCQLPDNTPPGNNPVPEPATMLLLGAGIAGIAGVRLRNKKK